LTGRHGCRVTRKPARRTSCSLLDRAQLKHMTPKSSRRWPGIDSHGDKPTDQKVRGSSPFGRAALRRRYSLRTILTTEMWGRCGSRPRRTRGPWGLCSLRVLFFVARPRTRSAGMRSVRCALVVGDQRGRFRVETETSKRRRRGLTSTLVESIVDP
jgi:hypothetical protein